MACLHHGLSQEGIEQARAAAQEVCNEATANGLKVCVVSSDFRRAWQTAQAVRAGCLAAGLEVWPPNGVLLETKLRERNFGDLDGLSDSQYPAVWAEDAHSDEHEIYGVESIRSVLTRSTSVVHHLEACDALRDSRWLVVLVAHGDVLQILATAFAQVDPCEHRSLEHLPTATLRSLA